MTLENGSPVVGVAAIAHSCLISGSDGTVQCWGVSNESGQLGRGTFDNATSSFVAQVLTAPSTPLKGAVRISGDGSTTCAVTTDKKAYCWGANAGSNGILTTGGLKSEWAIPVQAADQVLFTDVKTISVSQHLACATKSDDTAWCWGENANGPVGNGSTAPVRYPTQLTTLSNKVKQIDAVHNTACALVKDGTVYCWGYNGTGLVGNGVNGGDVKTPSQVVMSLGGAALDNVEQVIVGSTGAGDPFGLGNCAVRADHTLWCWGTGGVIKPTQLKTGISRVGRLAVFTFYLDGRATIADQWIGLPCP